MKSKISKAKRNNQKKNKLVKQGKIKSKKSKITSNHVQQKATAEVFSEEESDKGEDFLEMMEESDVSFLRNAVLNKSYNFLRKIRPVSSEPQSRKRKLESDDEALEEKYEKDANLIDKPKVLKMMLPVKTKQGLVEQTIEVEDEEENDDDNDKEEETNDDIEFENVDELDKNEPITTAKILLIREKTMNSLNERVGLLCSGILEDPEGNIANFRHLFQLIDTAQPEVWLSIRKLTIISLMEVFKDLLPSYSIREQSTKEAKLKKDTLHLIKYEEQLLTTYKSYLQKLEKVINVIVPKKGRNNKLTLAETNLAEVAVFALCELMCSNMYFNYSKNICQVLIPLLNNKNPKIRQTIGNSVKKIFQSDKKGDVTLTILQRINSLVKLRAASLHLSVLEPLLALRIVDINLDQEKEQNIKKNNVLKKKHKLLQMSKKEKKRKKKLALLSKELLETKAEEDKATKQKCQTEIVKTIFTIYFRILKQNPNIKILSVVLEGLAKFAHVINLDFYSDLVDVINRLLDDQNLSCKDQLHCILTVFTILSGQGDVLNIDPLRFYTHLYKNLLNFHAGHSQSDLGIALDTLNLVLIKRRKKITPKRAVAFIKRLGVMSLQTVHAGAVACLALIESMMQLSSAADILLDCDLSIGDGKYLAETSDPEYANANNASLWELVLLSQHYHPVVRNIATYIAQRKNTGGENSLPQTLKHSNAKDLFIEYDMSQMAFKPAIPQPSKKNKHEKKTRSNEFLNSTFQEYCKRMQMAPLTHVFID